MFEGDKKIVEKIKQWFWELVTDLETSDLFERCAKLCVLALCGFVGIFMLLKIPGVVFVLALIAGAVLFAALVGVPWLAQRHPSSDDSVSSDSDSSVELS